MSREKRLVLLAAVFFVSGLFFFVSRGGHTVQVITSPETPASSLQPASSLPAPHTYDTFIYRGEASRRVQGECKDVYYALLVFEEGVDYRHSPLDAKYNVATACTGGAFAADIMLSALPLEEGRTYYVVRAHQGARGGWYNPY